MTRVFRGRPGFLSLSRRFRDRGAGARRLSCVSLSDADLTLALDAAVARWRRRPGGGHGPRWNGKVADSVTNFIFRVPALAFAGTLANVKTHPRPQSVGRSRLYWVHPYVWLAKRADSHL